MGEGRPQCGPHLQAWPHILVPAKGQRACRHPHSSGLEQGLWAPEAPGVPALLSRKGPARARQPGHHHLDSPGLPCDPPPPLCSQETPIPDSCTKRSLQWAQPWVTQGLPGPSMDRALQGLTGQGAAHTGPEGDWAEVASGVHWGAPLQCHVAESCPHAHIAP